MKKRMTSLVLALAMCLSLCTTVFADPGASVEEKRAYLLNTCNIPADFLDSATSDTISSLYEDATKNYITVSSYEVETKSMLQQEQEVSPLGNIPTKDMKLRTLVTKVFDRSNKFLRLAVYVNFEWLNKAPFWRLADDGITVNWNDDILEYDGQSGFYLKLYYKADTSKDWIRYYSQYSPTKSVQGGLGVIFDLHNDYQTYLKGEMCIPLYTIEEDEYGSGRRTTINSNYAHTYVVPNISLSLVATNPGIDFSTTLGRDFCSNSATVTLA